MQCKHPGRAVSRGEPMQQCLRCMPRACAVRARNLRFFPRHWMQMMAVAALTWPKLQDWYCKQVARFK